MEPFARRIEPGSKTCGRSSLRAANLAPTKVEARVGLGAQPLEWLILTALSDAVREAEVDGARGEPFAVFLTFAAGAELAGVCDFWSTACSRVPSITT